MKRILIKTIGKQLNIPISGDKEDICRAVYSLAGQMALASLWDHDEMSDSVSIQHFKDRSKQILYAYENLYPEIKYVFPVDKSELLHEIYTIYRRCGYLYHSAYKISPSISVSSGFQDITLHRGSFPNAQFFMSGLGFYSIEKSSHEKTITQMFGLQAQSFDVYLNDLLSNNEWETIEWPDNTEFLRIDPPFSGGYWKLAPDTDGRIALARYGAPNKLFVFYQYRKGKPYQITIPEWRIRDFSSDNLQSYSEYRRIATALLIKHRVLPNIIIKEDRDLVEIKLGYRLPPSEEDFFKLFSWPVHYSFTSDLPPVFRRKMASRVFPAFRHELESLGYQFTEDKL